MTKVKLARTKPTKIAYIEHRGNFAKIPWGDDLAKLYGYAKAHKLRPAMHPIGIYPDDPAKVPESALRSEVALPIRGDAPPEGDILVKALPEMDVATLKFRGPSTEYARAYAEIQAWVDANGFVAAGPAMEVYTKRPKVRGGQTELTATIEVPVRKR